MYITFAFINFRIYWAAFEYHTESELKPSLSIYLMNLLRMLGEESISYQQTKTETFNRIRS